MVPPPARTDIKGLVMITSKKSPISFAHLILCMFSPIILLGITACSTIEDAPRRPREANINATISLDVPEIMRGTVASQAYLVGYADRDVVVKGYGLVVGLKGTGHRILNAQIRAHMLAEMARMGVRRAGTDLGMTPDELLDSMDTAVVVIEAIIPPGSPEGSRFDVRIAAIPQTETSSLEGGTLWTSELRPALGPGLPAVGSRQARAIALAKGKVFTNPFVIYPEDFSTGNSDENETDQETLNRMAGTSINLRGGHILSGGITLRSMPLKLRLATPSHNVANHLQQVINTYFPQEPGQQYPTAHGESSESIELTVPTSFRGRERDFVHLVQHCTMFVPAVDPVVSYINRTLKQNPGDAVHAMWRWQALGVAVLPAIKELYTYPEEAPRYAALHAGAKLKDPQVVPHLLELAANGSASVQTDAIELLGNMNPDPKVIFGLRDMLNHTDVDVRIAAYEALAKTNSMLIRSEIVEDKFMVDFVESKYPLIYVTLLEVPRIVVFGENVEVVRPMTLSTWSNRLLLIGDIDRDTITVSFSDGYGSSGLYQVSPYLGEFIPFLGHSTSIEQPAPGLGLSYSETVGVLWAMHQSRYLAADFRTEQDRIAQQIREQEADGAVYEARPEFNKLLEETAPPESEYEKRRQEISDEEEFFAPLGQSRVGDAGS